MTAEHHVAVTRTARYVTVGEPGPAISDVWFALHGYGQLAPSFARHCQPLAAPHRLVVVPEGLSRFYLGDHTRPAGPDAKIGASWMTREDRLSEITDYVRYLDQLHATIFSRLPGTGVRVTVLGFSQGAPTATRWLTRGDAVADRLILWGAPMPADLDPALDGARLRRSEVVLVAGDRDDYITPKVIAAEETRLATMNVRFRTLRYPGGHAIDPGTLQELAKG